MGKDDGKTEGTGTGRELQDDRAQNESEKTTIDERRRALIRAGWAVPAVTAVPGLAFNAAYAQSPHGDGHTDSTPHTDTHDDHIDVPHTDHTDVHGDVPHGDGHTDSHGDVLHLDTTLFHIDDTILHIDFFTIPHGDAGSGVLHLDTPALGHNDIPGSHGDVPGLHTDVGVVDEHQDVHIDTP